MNQRRLLADKLVACELVTPALRNKYREEVTKMLEKPLGTAARAVWVFWMVFGLGQVTLFGFLTVWSYGKLPVWGSLLFGMACLFGIAFSVVSGWIAYSGRMLLNVQPPLISGLAWALVVLVVTILMVAAPDSLAGLRAITCGLVFLVLGAVFLLNSRMEQAELRSKEKLLEIEYRLADLAEQVQEMGKK
jgi:hypothetical protein